MGHPNTGWLFYKNYYLADERGRSVQFLGHNEAQNRWTVIKNDNEHNERLFERRNKELFEQTIPDLKDLAQFPTDHLQTFQLMTTYPGLLIGSGYNHGTGKKGELKLGFFFDFTTGLPTIPASSIKGLLRSAFPGMDYQRHYTTKSKEAATAYKANYSEKTDYMTYLLGEVGIPVNTIEQICQIEWEIFAGIKNYALNPKTEMDGRKSTNPTGDKMPISQRDVFLDAFITGPVGKEFLADDYITPHKNNTGDGYPDEMKNPVPISFLKVLPEITFEFRFNCKDGTYINAQQKKSLFHKILLQHGIGAKTNVGYGQLVDVASDG